MMSPSSDARDTSSRSLSGKVAVVTGASRGIGRAVAERLAASGVTVILQYKSGSDEALAAASAIRSRGGAALALQADIASVDSIERFFATLEQRLLEQVGSPGLDILVNNAGVCETIDFEHTDESTFDRLFDVNVKGLFFMTRRALRHLRPGGRVINVSSVAARAHFPRIAAYAATKGAVNTLTLQLAAALGPRNITVNAVSPGVTDTAMNPWLQTLEGQALAKGMQALQRIGTPNDIAAAVLFLASPEAGWVTGMCLEASGGMKL
jgi:NAD(P)-dependent dehydrogenase (short-subunit alcohol dehydrogenase family)